jgi:hypothetical protein
MACLFEEMCRAQRNLGEEGAARQVGLTESVPPTANAADAKACGGQHGRDTEGDAKALCAATNGAAKAELAGADGDKLAASKSLSDMARAHKIVGDQPKQVAGLYLLSAALLFSTSDKTPFMLNVKGDGRCFIFAQHRAAALAAAPGKGKRYRPPLDEDVQDAREAWVQYLRTHPNDRIEVLQGLERTVEDLVEAERLPSETTNEQVLARLRQQFAYCDRAMVYAASKCEGKIFVLFRGAAPPDVVRAVGVPRNAPVLPLALIEDGAYQHYMVLTGMDGQALKRYAAYIVGDEEADEVTKGIVACLNAMFEPPTEEKGEAPRNDGTKVRWWGMMS